MTLPRFSMFRPPLTLEFRWKAIYLCGFLTSVLALSAGCGASKEAAVERAPATVTEVDSAEEIPSSLATDGAAEQPESAEKEPSPPTLAMDSRSGGAADSGLGSAATSGSRDASGLSGPLQSPVTGLDPATNSGSLSSVDSSNPGDSDEPEELPTYDATNPLEEGAKKAFAAPEGMRRLTKDSNLWIDTEQKRLVVDGYVAITQGPLEMFACPTGKKEHESIVAVLAKAREVHAGLLAVGADSGTPVAFSPEEYRPATGQRIAIWCLWRDSDGKIEKTPAQKWVKNLRDDKVLELDWVFAGSSFWKDPESGREYYQADSGDLVCVSNFTTAMMDLPIESSQSNGELIFVANTEYIPAPGTPIRLVFVPIPIAGTDVEPGAADPTVAPEDGLLVSGE